MVEVVGGVCNNKKHKVAHGSAAKRTRFHPSAKFHDGLALDAFIYDTLVIKYCKGADITTALHIVHAVKLCVSNTAVRGFCFSAVQDESIFIRGVWLYSCYRLA
jgi:hypothetical protein